MHTFFSEPGQFAFASSMIDMRRMRASSPGNFALRFRMKRRFTS